MDAEISAGSFGRCPAAGESFREGGGDTPLQEANGDVLLDGVALFSTGVTIMESQIFGFWG